MKDTTAIPIKLSFVIFMRSSLTRFCVLLSIAIFCLFSFTSQGQLWSGILDSSRAIDWTPAGVVGGIPSATWTQCGSTVAAGSSVATINAAISACGVNQFVLLGVGSFGSLSSCVILKSNMEVRGSGANQTFLTFIGNGCSSCGGLASAFCMGGSNSSPNSEQNACDWISGFSPGTTTIGLGNCGATTPAAGSAANIAVGTILTLDQLDTATDTGEVFNNFETGTTSNGGSGGFARTDGTCNGTFCDRSQQQLVTVVSVSGTGTSRTAVITPPIRMANWATGQKPQATFATSNITNCGVQNLSVDNASGGNSGARTFQFFNASNCWLQGVRSLTAPRAHVGTNSSVHLSILSNYGWQSQSHASTSYGAENTSDSDNLFANNIWQQVTEPFPNNGGGSGDVWTHNFCVNDVYFAPGWFQPCANNHASGNNFELFEGNIGGGFQADNVHGTHQLDTVFRNLWLGNQATCAGSPCSAQTDPVQIYAASRFYNFVGNVLGQPGYHTNYTCSATSVNPSCASGNTSIFVLGFTGNGGANCHANPNAPCSPPIIGFGTDCGNGAGTNSFDTCTSTGLMRWGNCDTVNGSCLFNSAEVPSGLAQFPNAVPATHALPPSFYWSAKPPYWGSQPWPPIGPDVTSGGVGICSGGTMSGSLALSSGQCPGGSLVTYLSGTANPNPAMSCFLNTMGGPADGSGGALTFNFSTCYPAQASNATPGPPTNGLVKLSRTERKLYEESAIGFIIAARIRGMRASSYSSAASSSGQ